jgi:peptidoglycan/xylan/chitin deacetylase (PgdA/CDA1 family)
VTPAAVTVSFDNLGEVADLGRGRWPGDAPLGRHASVTRVLPELLEALAGASVSATFFVEGLNAELYPDALASLVDAGHEVAYHGWCHEDWAALAPQEEATLLDRGRRAMTALGIELRGLRPPGGRLTAETLGLLRSRGFTHCSPAGKGMTRIDGIAVLPFRWALVDAYYVLPRFGALRERDRGSPAPLGPGTWRAVLDAALAEEGGRLSVLFHPFLLEDLARMAVLRDFLEAVRATGARCATHAEVAAGPLPGDDLRLDLSEA